MEVHHLNLDDLTGQLREGDLPISVQLREKIMEAFGTTERIKLGNIVFSNPALLQKLNQLYKEPLMTVLRQELYGKKGVVLVEGAILVEFRWDQICNNNVIVVREPDTTQYRDRLIARGLTPQQIQNRVGAQYDYAHKVQTLQEHIAADHYGRMFSYDSTTASEGPILELWKNLQVITQI